MFLCGNQEKYDKINVLIGIHEENEILKEKYIQSLGILQKLYDEGNLILNQNRLEKIQIYLEKSKFLEAIGGNGLDELPKDPREEFFKAKEL